LNNTRKEKKEKEFTISTLRGKGSSQRDFEKGKKEGKDVGQETGGGGKGPAKKK